MPLLDGIVLSHFESVDPRHSSRQEDLFEWFLSAHAVAQHHLRNGGGTLDVSARREKSRGLLRFGCAPDKIARRFHEPSDFLHLDWERMRLFNLLRDPRGAGLAERTRFFAEAVDGVFERMYPSSEDPPDDLLHVTCTGYVSPSGAQKLVARRGWSSRTTVSHAYHMGCNASVPALRMAAGFLASSLARRPREAARRVDIVHTELCTLHMDPSTRDPEQLVVASLFADGYVKYSARPSILASEGSASGLRVLGIREEILPDTTDAMTWQCTDHAMRMTLDRKVPSHLAANLAAFLDGLFAAAGSSYAERKSSVILAVHPGGPRIVETVQELLDAPDWSVAHSKRVLLERGNMSSATLPYVWKEIVESDAVPRGMLIAGLAFGPGLTVSGALLEKV